MTLALDLLPHPSSALSRLDPRWKLAGLSLAAACTTLLRSLAAAELAFLGTLVLVVLGRLPLRWYLSRLGALVPFLALFVILMPFLVGGAEVWNLGPWTLSSRGLQLALVLVLKALAVVTLMLVVLTTAPLNTTLHAAHCLRVPGLAIHLVLLTYRYAFLLAGELARIRIALRVRGYRNRATLHSYRTVGHVAGTLMVRSYERADRIGHAMRCRSFDGHFRSLAEFRTRACDLAYFLVIAGASAGLVVLDSL